MSGAFFTVYMLNRIGIPMSGIIMLAVLSQITNIYFFKVWGTIADRYSNKSVLAVSVPLFIFILLLYPFTTLPERHSLTIPALNLRGIDFVFCIAALTGLYAWHRLSLIDEAGTVSEAEIRDQVFASVRNTLQRTSGLNMGMRRMTAFPYEMLRRTGKSTRATLYRATHSGRAPTQESSIQSDAKDEPPLP